MTKPHWLAPGGKNWTPQVLVYFDTESVETPESTNLVHRLRCWDAVVDVRGETAPQMPRRRLVAGEALPELVALVEDAAAITKECWVLAHNLNFDLAVTQLPAILATRRWTVEAYGLSKESNWWVLKRDGQKVVVADSWSWIPTSLAVAGADIGRRKLALPKQDASLADWHRRCRHDAVILADVFTTILDWWDEHGLGRFGITGAGCGWQAMRTKTGPHKMVVGPEDSRTAFERRAIYGGRKEVYQVGEIKGEWVADYDFQGAYPTIAAHHRLPVAAMRPFATMPASVVPGETEGRDVICECVVTTDRPCVPLRIEHDVWWPVGTFTTVLTGPEIAYARSVGATVTTGRGYLYRTDFALRPWAVWCLQLLHSSAVTTPPLIRRMAKGWSRSVIGRFGGHTSRITSERPAIGWGWRLETGHNLDTGRPLEVLTIGDRELTTEHDLDGADSFPAVLAFVEGHCRVALARMMDSRRPDRVIQCNTDGWWERRVVRSAAYEVDGVPWPHTVVRKACVHQAVVLGPDHLQTPAERRLAGVSGEAEGSLADGWSWHDWPGLRWQLERAAAGTYARPKRELELRTHYARRWVLENGETVPVTVTMDDTGTVSILPWSLTWGRRQGDVLAPYQDGRLAGLADGGSLVPTLFDGSGPALPGRRLGGGATAGTLRTRRRGRRVVGVRR